MTRDFLIAKIVGLAWPLLLSPDLGYNVLLEHTNHSTDFSIYLTIVVSVAIT